MLLTEAHQSSIVMGGYHFKGGDFMDASKRLEFDLCEIDSLYKRLKPDLTEKEIERLTPHVKATSKLLQEFELDRSIAATKKRMNSMSMFITGKLNKID